MLESFFFCDLEALMDDQIWCEEYKDYYGNSDPKYGGILTDLRELPVGTTFFRCKWFVGGRNTVR
jgi:hypothetical protein